VVAGKILSVKVKKSQPEPGLKKFCRQVTGDKLEETGMNGSIT